MAKAYSPVRVWLYQVDWAAVGSAAVTATTKMTIGFMTLTPGQIDSAIRTCAA